MFFVLGIKVFVVIVVVVLVLVLLGGIVVIVIWLFVGFWGFFDVLFDVMMFCNWEWYLDGVLLVSVIIVVIGIISVCFVLILIIWMFEIG